MAEAHIMMATLLRRYRIIRADGEIRNIHEASDRQPGFSVTVRQGTIQDVTEIKQTEENLAESEARFN